MSPTEELLLNMERLESHLDAINSGSQIARDELATVLQIMTHDGHGFDLINKSLNELGYSGLQMPGYQSDQTYRSYDGKDVALAIRPVNQDPLAVMALSDLLKQEAIYHDNSSWASNDSITWKQIIAHSRNNHGAHAGEDPKAWLEDLRIFPISDSDVMTFLLWSFGEALLEALTTHYATNGFGMMIHKRRTSLNGINLKDAHILHQPPTSIIAGTDLMITEESTRPRTLFGGMYNDTPFVVGMSALRRVNIIRGNKGNSIEDLESEFLFGNAGDNMNRYQRRQLKQRSKQ